MALGSVCYQQEKYDEATDYFSRVLELQERYIKDDELIRVLVAQTVTDELPGPLNMGLCRGLNLLLGVSIVTTALNEWWFIAFVPVIYIAAITMISRGEVHGGNKSALYFSVFLYGVVIMAILLLSYAKGMFWWTILFLLPFAWMIFSALMKAIRLPLPQNIGKAVKAGVIALILMNAAWAAAFGAIILAFLIVLLLPLSLWMAKLFAVT